MRTIQRNAKILSAVVLAMVVAGAACTTRHESDTGTVGLNLLAAPGVEIDQVQWTIHNPALLTADRTGTVDVSRSGTLQFVVGGLPAGSGYTITVTATTSTGVGCLGAAMFAITAGSTANVSLSLVCTQTSVDAGTNGSVSINGQVSVANPCAAISSLSAAPSSVEVGGSVQLSTQGVDSTGNSANVGFSWAVTGGTGAGTFSGTTTASPSLTCTSAGTLTVTVTASTPGGGSACTNNTASVQLTCTPPGGVCVPGTPRCNGLQREQCDATGAWQANGSACTYVCSAGACSGTCHPGALTCAGLQPQQCDMTGTPKPQGPACQHGCVNGACVGCTPGQVRCSGMQPQVCDAAGNWQSRGPACSIACISANCAVCIPGQARSCGTQTCASDGSWGSCVGDASVTRTCNDCGTQACDPMGSWGACSGNNGTQPPTCSSLAPSNTCGQVTCDTSRGVWNTAGCFSPNTCGDYRSDGYVFVGTANGMCRYSQTYIGATKSDSGVNHFFGSLDSGLTGGGPPNKQFDHGELSFRYAGGGCWCNGNNALGVSCATGSSYGVTEIQAGCNSNQGGSVVTLDDIACDVIQLEGWTPFAQGTCQRQWDLTDFWNAPFACF